MDTKHIQGNQTEYSENYRNHMIGRLVDSNRQKVATDGLISEVERIADAHGFRTDHVSLLKTLILPCLREMRDEIEQDCDHFRRGVDEIYE